MQFMLDTSLSDAGKHPLKLSDLIVYPCDPWQSPIDFMWAASPDLAVPDLPVTGCKGPLLPPDVGLSGCRAVAAKTRPPMRW